MNLLTDKQEHVIHLEMMSVNAIKGKPFTSKKLHWMIAGAFCSHPSDCSGFKQKHSERPQWITARAQP